MTQCALHRGVAPDAPCDCVRLARLEAVLAAANTVALPTECPRNTCPSCVDGIEKLREAIRLCDSQEDGKGEGAKMLLGHEDDCQIMRLGRKDLACDCSRFARSGAADRETP